jgi:ligand-binding sensor domain-containing protein
MTKIFIQADFDKVAQTCEPWQPSICRIFRCPSKGQPHYGEISIPTVFLHTLCASLSIKAKELGKVVSSMGKSVMYIHQDKANNYWFGGVNGLYRYDGKTLVHFTTADGLPSERIEEIREDNAGNLFFNTSNGVCKYNGQSFTPLLVVANNPISPNVWKLAPGDLWFKGSIGKGGLLRWDGKKLYQLFLPKHYMEDAFYTTAGRVAYSPYDVYYIYTDKRGHLWIGTSNLGLCRYNGKSISWLYEEHLTKVPAGGSFGIRSIYEDKNSKFWLCNTRYRYDISLTDSTGTGQNFIKYRKRTGTGPLKSPDGNDHVYAFAFVEDNKGDLWMATYTEGVWRYDGRQAKKYLLKANGKVVTTYNLYKDHNGAIWLGTHENGAYKFNGKEFVRFMP